MKNIGLILIILIWHYSDPTKFTANDIAVTYEMGYGDALDTLQKILDHQTDDTIHSNTELSIKNYDTTYTYFLSKDIKTK